MSDAPLGTALTSVGATVMPLKSPPCRTFLSCLSEVLEEVARLILALKGVRLVVLQESDGVVGRHDEGREFVIGLYANGSGSAGQKQTAVYATQTVLLQNNTNVYRIPRALTLASRGYKFKLQSDSSSNSFVCYGTKRLALTGIPAWTAGFRGQAMFS